MNNYWKNRMSKAKKEYDKKINMLLRKDEQNKTEVRTKAEKFLNDNKEMLVDYILKTFTEYMEKGNLLSPFHISKEIFIEGQPELFNLEFQSQFVRELGHLLEKTLAKAAPDFCRFSALVVVDPYYFWTKYFDKIQDAKENDYKLLLKINFFMYLMI